jgi:hypothetical protein
MNITDCIKRTLDVELNGIALVTVSDLYEPHNSFSIIVEQFPEETAMATIVKVTDLVNQCMGNSANISMMAEINQFQCMVSFAIFLKKVDDEQV